ncbi:MAG: cytochrome c nitrite reductase small subunit [Sphingobacteriales bacterium]|jgi:cytochrome c nitrite reductase small subunit|nr:cytochrome c nitrite reductase small subunit [Sphingobacteriales bacterium]
MSLSLEKINIGKNKKRYRFIIPVLLGLIIGLIGFILYISKAHSYLSDDPKACINCHIMAPEYATWSHSSHGRNTVCNDCHVPHDNFVRKYYFKAMDGLRHATIFSWRAEPQVIRMLKPGETVVQENCIRCHDQLNSVVSTAVTAKQARHGEGKLCWDCHTDVPHGTKRGLNSAPNARVPLAETPVPEWLDKMIKENKHTNKD